MYVADFLCNTAYMDMQNTINLLHKTTYNNIFKLIIHLQF